MAIVVRPTPPDAAEQVAALPRRVAHVVYAVQAISHDLGNGPWRASEIITYDPEALTVASTSGALRRALARGLVDRWGHGIWTTTPHADDLRDALESRFLSETESGEETNHGSD